ncbi:MAG: hypothetical protein LBS55_05290 [Prevotellaceae bacterium]|jgi:hypothetical protein|nr:hypothetical protein [Prevotellaceae bacterium]
MGKYIYGSGGRINTNTWEIEDTLPSSKSYGWIFGVVACIFIAFVVVMIIVYNNASDTPSTLSTQTTTPATPQTSPSTRPQNKSTPATSKPQTSPSTRSQNKSTSVNATSKQRLEYDNGYYEGETKNGTRHGHGTYYWTTGNRYEGEWVNGQQTGRGTYYYANKTVEKGQFVNGKWIKDETPDGNPSQSTNTTYADDLHRANAAFQKGIKDGKNAHFEEAYRLYLKSNKNAGYKKFKERAEEFQANGLDDEYRFFINYANKLK